MQPKEESCCEKTSNCVQTIVRIIAFTALDHETLDFDTTAEPIYKYKIFSLEELKKTHWMLKIEKCFH